MTLPYYSPDSHDKSRRLRILSTIQYVGAALLVIQLPTFILVVVYMDWKKAGHAGSPSTDYMIRSFHTDTAELIPYVSWSVICCLLGIYSGRQISMGRRRIQSVVIAALQCILGPVGALLGLGTMIALFTNGFKRAYNCEFVQNNSTTR